MTKEKTKEETNVGYKLIEVPTEMGLAIQTPDEKVVSVNELMVKMANDLLEIKEFILEK